VKLKIPTVAIGIVYVDTDKPGIPSLPPEGFNSRIPMANNIQVTVSGHPDTPDGEAFPQILRAKCGGTGTYHPGKVALCS